MLLLKNREYFKNILILLRIKINIFFQREKPDKIIFIEIKKMQVYILLYI